MVVVFELLFLLIGEIAGEFFAHLGIDYFDRNQHRKN
jgi:hypothetical protein